METRNEFIPFAISHPGKILGRELEERGIKQKDFAKRIGMQPTHLNNLIKGRLNISERIASKLEKGLDIPALDWLNMQSKYDYFKVSLEQKGREEAVALQKETELNMTLNLKFVYDFLQICQATACERLKKLTDFGNPEYASSLELACRGYFKRSEKCQIDERNMRTWLFVAHCKAEQTSASGTYTDDSAESAASEIAAEANAGRLTTAKIQSILGRHGIGYVHVPKLDKTPVDAYSTKIDGRRVIVVTYRHNDMDKLTFDVLHELGHIALHLQEDGQSFIAADTTDRDATERDADSFAREHLIPSAVWKRIIACGANTVNPYIIIKRIGEQAKMLGISPSIAVARYKHDTNAYNFQGYRSPKLQ